MPRDNEMTADQKTQWARRNDPVQAPAKKEKFYVLTEKQFNEVREAVEIAEQYVEGGELEQWYEAEAAIDNVAVFTKTIDD